KWHISERLLVASGLRAFVSHVANENPFNLRGKSPRRFTINFRVLFAGVTDQHESSLGELLQQRLNHAVLVPLRRLEQIEKGFVLPAKWFQMKGAGGEAVAAGKLCQRWVKLPRAGRYIVKLR